MWCCKCCLADFIWKVAKWIISREGLIMRKNLKEMGTILISMLLKGIQVQRMRTGIRFTLHQEHSIEHQFPI